MRVSPRLRAGLQAFGALTGVALLAYVLHTAFGLGSPELDGLFDWVYCGLIVAAGAICITRAIAFREERAAWLVMGAGLLAWAAGEVTWTTLVADDPNPPYPSVSDALYLSFYPASYTALLLLARSRTDSFRSSLWLDGAIAGLTVAALIATLAFQPIVDATSGGPAEIAVNIAYPVGDLLLLGLVVAVFGLNGWRPDPVWLVLGGGLALTAVADGFYLVQSATDTYVEGTLLDVAWPVSALLVAVAAWQPVRKKIAIRDWLIIAVPVGCGLVAVQLLVYDHFERSVNLAAVSLAAWALLLALARMALAFLENQRSLSQSHTEARTDSLTGLRNRRSLLADLEIQLGLSSLASPRALLLFDLDGFKEYNDAFGHPAGDGLLVRLAARLAEAVGPSGDAYRLGGDEFCVLVSPGRDGIDAVLASLLRGARTSAARASRSRARSAWSRCRRRRARPRRRFSSPTGACTRARAGAGCRPAASPATSCCGLCPSGAPTFSSGFATSASWRWRSGASCTWAPRGSTRWPAPPSSTTWARSRSRTPSSTSPARSTPSSGASCAATR